MSDENEQKEAVLADEAAAKQEQEWLQEEKEDGGVDIPDNQGRFEGEV